MAEDEQNTADNILTRQIKSWKGFEYALKEENRILFNMMLTEWHENQDYVMAVSSKGEPFAAESLFMILILQLQKIIKQLIARLSEPK